MHELLYLGQAVTSDSLLNGNSILLGNLGKEKVCNSRQRSLREHLGESVRKVIVEKETKQKNI